ncbi:MAG: DUF1573 domain-containing protein [Candidatus Cloacimonetes bacterium]|nr:DUF1573 domain-containing protein [Candidatus Cloacimonadota bacterium]
MILVIIIFGILFSLHSSPIITFEKDEHNFGDIREEDGKVECDFIFTNDGDEPLKLIKVKAG